MNQASYELRLQNLDEADGEIKADDLTRVLNALLLTAERASRLFVLGEGSAPGNRPAWLTACRGVTVKGLKKGSTVLALQAPTLEEVASEQFAQKDFLRETPDLKNSALDLAARAIQEATSAEAESDLLDASVIDAALKFEKAVKGSNIIYSFKPKDGTSGSFQLKEGDYEVMKGKKAALPEPCAFVVSGKLDVIQHTKGQFKLALSNGETLLGRIHPEFLEQAALQNLWGQKVTIEGMVSFRANGSARLIVARKLLPETEGDAVFASLPHAKTSLQQSVFFSEDAPVSEKADPMSLWGLWEGDESVDELLAQLD